MATYTLSHDNDLFPDTGQDISGDDLIDALNGEDTITGGAGDDTLLGGEGNDRLNLDFADADITDGGGGYDTASYRDSSVAVTMDATASPFAARLIGIEAFDLTDLDDVLTAAAGQSAYGYGGADRITNLGGFVTIGGGDGDDTIVSGLGDGALLGGAGADRFELLVGDEDSVDGGDGYDLVSWQGSASAVRFDPTDFPYYTLLDNLEAFELTGFDDRFNSNGFQSVYGLGGADIISGSGDIVLDGGDGDDSVSWFFGNINFVGGQGGDVLHFQYAPQIYDIEKIGDGVFQVTDLSGVLAARPNDVMTVSGFETFSFGDGTEIDATTFEGSPEPTTQTQDLTNFSDVLGENASDWQVYFGQDVIHGRGGADRIYSHTGNDTLTGDAGNDTLNGSDGDDSVLGGDGDDVVAGEAGDDTVSGGSGVNRLEGGTGDDILIGGDGVDQFWGFWGTGDTADYSGATSALELVLTGATMPYGFVYNATGSAYVDGDMLRSIDGLVLSGFGDALTLDRGAGEAVTDRFLHVDGGGGDDTLRGSVWTDHLSGGDGGDILAGAGDADLLGGGGGDDTQTGGAGSDSHDGGDGVDAAVFGGNQADYLIQNVSGVWYVTAANADADTLVNVERFVFDDGEFDATAPTNALTIDQAVLAGYSGAPPGAAAAASLSSNVYGGGGGDVLSGTGRSDRIGGLGGDDRINAKAGNDLLAGGDGNDLLSGGAGLDQLSGGAGDDRLKGGLGGDLMVGGAGSDTYYVDDTGDRVFERAKHVGVDIVNSTVDFVLGAGLERLTLMGAAVTGTGNDADNMLEGDAAANVLSGLGGKDRLFGGAGDDRLDGGAGRDLLGGGSGHDRLTGGDGADRFVFQAGFGKDVILDFQAGVDVLDLSAVDAAGWSPAVSQVGSDTLMLFEDGSSLTLIGVQASDLGGQDGLWT